MLGPRNFQARTELPLSRRFGAQSPISAPDSGLGVCSRDATVGGHADLRLPSTQLFNTAIPKAQVRTRCKAVSPWTGILFTPGSIDCSNMEHKIVKITMFARLDASLPG
ncbi:hypothetical protein VTI28DRAFT_2887 [Corynascus sepedonium]